MKKKKQAHHKHFCTYCFYSAKGYPDKCAKCTNPVIGISHKFHLPSPKAKKAKWKKFFVESQFLITGYMNDPEIKARVMKTLDKK